MKLYLAVVVSFLFLAGCGVLLAEKPMPIGDQVWRDTKRIGY